VKLLRRIFQLGGVAAACLLAAAAQTPPQTPGPEQPLPFSHKHHAGKLNLKCTHCHRNPDPGEKMTFAPTGICMECHSEIGTDKPSIQKLTAFDKEKRELRWVRVYEIPTYVFFSHRAHLAAGSTCVECHGQVQERERIYKEGDISMKGCITCHTAKNASIDCAFCHERM
jgi:hypothetical protein